MTYNFPLKEYRLTDGRVFTPSHHSPADLSLIMVSPGDEVSQDESVKILYNFIGVPITLKGNWDSEIGDWIFDVEEGLSKDGQDIKPFIGLF